MKVITLGMFLIFLICCCVSPTFARDEQKMVSAEAAKKIAEQTGFSQMTNFSQDVAKEMLLNDFKTDY